MNRFSVNLPFNYWLYIKFVIISRDLFAFSGFAIERSETDNSGGRRRERERDAK
jgi:hypothetical protein